MAHTRARGRSDKPGYDRKRAAKGIKIARKGSKARKSR